MDRESCRSDRLIDESQISAIRLWEERQQLAFAVAAAAHAGQTDKAGHPYIEHPVAVASMLETPEQKIVALLHDVLEDTDMTEEDLRDYGFPASVIEAVCLLTREPQQDYIAYIEKLRHNELARAVKLADLTHNMDLGRLPEITKKDRLRQKKYERAKAILLEGK
ncbi:MAG: HD domain-containing protein [Lachnospiraceae bacterium]|nr:HD domain-containing protein [Lachnospiraceae bacterium]MDY5742863.1 HD domain-containing protein [Lachnospiraceae bacterium]